MWSTADNKCHAERRWLQVNQRQGGWSMRIAKAGFLTLLFLALGIVPSTEAQSTVGTVTLSKANITGTAVLGSGKYPGYNPSQSSLCEARLRPARGAAKFRFPRSVFAGRRGFQRAIRSGSQAEPGDQSRDWRELSWSHHS